MTKVVPLAIPPRASARQHPLESPRLLLQPLDTTDAQELWAAIEGSRQHLGRWLPWVPFTDSLTATLRFIEASAIDWDTGRSLRYLIRERGSRRLLGVVGLDACVHLHRAAELGYWLKRDVTGHGFMTEAARTLVDAGFQRLHLHRIRCAAATDNHASLQVIARLGFRFEGLARHAEWVDARWLDHAVFAKLATDD